MQVGKFGVEIEVEQVIAFCRLRTAAWRGLGRFIEIEIEQIAAERRCADRTRRARRRGFRSGSVGIFTKRGDVRRNLTPQGSELLPVGGRNLAAQRHRGLLEFRRLAGREINFGQLYAQILAAWLAFDTTPQQVCCFVVQTIGEMEICLGNGI